MVKTPCFYLAFFLCLITTVGFRITKQLMNDYMLSNNERIQAIYKMVFYISDKNKNVGSPVEDPHAIEKLRMIGFIFHHFFQHLFLHLLSFFRLQ